MVKTERMVGVDPQDHPVHLESPEHQDLRETEVSLVTLVNPDTLDLVEDL